MSSNGENNPVDSPSSIMNLEMGVGGVTNNDHSSLSMGTRRAMSSELFAEKVSNKTRLKVINEEEDSSEDERPPILVRCHSDTELDVRRKRKKIKKLSKRKPEKKEDATDKCFVEIHYEEINGISVYKDAAVYLQEGESNDRFVSHPKSWWSYLAYQLVHDEVYQYIQLAVSLLLMGLAIIEPPTFIDSTIIGPTIHGTLEIIFLLFFAMDTFIQLIWLQKAFFYNGRGLLKVGIILVELAEAVTVVIRQSSHVRVLRCLRPFFFLDSYVTSGVRRALRTIFSTASPIFDVLLLFLLVIAMFSLVAFYLFGNVTNIYFINFRESFINMFVAVTTANYPDVMMQAYAETTYAPIFFIVYLIITLYLLDSIFLAIIYGTFQGQTREKFKQLYYHKKDALRRAFQALRREDNALHFADFYLLMKAYKPLISKIRVLCMFKALDVANDDKVSLEEFYKFYDILNLAWERIDTKGRSIVWHERFPKPIAFVLEKIRTVIEWPMFDIFINLIIVANGVYLWVYTESVELVPGKPVYEQLDQLFAVSLTFTILYSIELLVKIFVLGPYRFFTRTWNVFDFVVVALAVIGQISEASFAGVFIFIRPLRLLRLLRLKRRYRDMMNTLVILVPQLISIGLLLFVIYYFFAIIGMEFLSNTVSPNCCHSNTSYPVDSFYMEPNGLYFFLNSFDNIFRSYVTLFELMVVNNWHIIMEGFRSSTNDYPVRAFFVAFYLATLVIVNIVITYIVDSFVSNFRYSERFREKLLQEEAEIVEEEVKEKKNICLSKTYFCFNAASLDDLSPEENDIKEVAIKEVHITGLERINAVTVFDRIFYQLHKKRKQASQGPLKFRGRRRRNREDINSILYQEDVEVWNEEIAKRGDVEFTKEDQSIPLWRRAARRARDTVEHFIL